MSAGIPNGSASIKVQPHTADPDRTVTLLGPQDERPTLAEHLETQGIEGRIATITAGWQEREDEVQALQTHLGGRSINLRLHARSEEIFQADTALATLHRVRQTELRRLRRLYAIRLNYVMEAALELTQLPGEDRILDEQRDAAIKNIQALDAEHILGIRAIHAEYDERLALDKHPEIRRHRDEVAEIVMGCEAIAIAGGHVAVLLNRMRLFDGPHLATSRPIIGWSAGAIILGERLVLYHDSPPQGAGNAEVFEEGLGLVRGIVALPHASKRLLLDDRHRVSRFARRFANARCLAMDAGASLTCSGNEWTASSETRQLYADGGVGEVLP